MSYHNANHCNPIHQQRRQNNEYDDGDDSRYFYHPQNEDGEYRHELPHNHNYKRYGYGDDEYDIVDDDDEQDEILDAIQAEIDRDEIDHALTSAMRNASLGTSTTTTESFPSKNHMSNANNYDHVRHNAEAAEYWYPECRDCPCCFGFKYGCEGCVGGYCVCSGGSRRAAGNDNGVGGITATCTAAATTATATVTGTPIDNHFDSNDTAVSSTGGAGLNDRGENTEFGKGFSGRGRGRGSSHGRSGRGQTSISGSHYLIPCRFYQMGTCKFGNGCRFSHA
mmetsp:Transcript_17895/g.37555  ORF Transcript_17895/g.37555 Transcript_17895/m.37555 type:complete len:280 (-) Transcript_17895:75-914(-)